jgi:putative tricarboxylic transport membrane protein
MDMWLQGFQVALSGSNPLLLLLGTVIGLVVGVLPAVGPSFGVTLALPFTYGLDPAAALILLCAIQSACAYGDSIASILVNVPGGPGTVASCWEGYPLTRQGRAGTALGIATGASFIGGIIGWLSFVLLAGPMTEFALIIGAPEYFVLGIMALALISIASKGETIKGLIMGCLGLLLGMIGSDPVTGMVYRFSFGLAQLEPGIEIVLGALAIFAIPQLVDMLEEGGTIAQISQIKDSVITGVLEVLKRPVTIIRAGIVGWLIGVMPALGTSAAGITSYLIEKRSSKHPEEYTHGSMEGLTAAEIGKGACILGDGITSLMLGVPGSVTWAILMAALIIHGVQPGPRFMTAGVLPYTVFAGLLLGQLAYFILGVLFVKYIAKVVYVPNQLLAPVVAVLCFLGAFAAKNYLFDIWIMVALGVFAFAANRSGFPTVPMILGFILTEIIEPNFHRALGVGFGSPLIFLQRPISAALVLITVIFLAWPWIADFIRKRRVVAKPAQAAEASSEIQLVDVLVEEEKEADTAEIVMGVVVISLLLLFLSVSLTYSPEVRLFPMIVSVTGLVLAVSRLVVAVRGKKLAFPSLSAVLARPKEGMAWSWTLALLVLYALAVPFLGLVVASGVFFVAVAFLSGYARGTRHWIIVAITTVAVLLCLMGASSVLRMELPAGIFGA